MCNIVNIIVCLHIISSYVSYLEPIVIKLQTVNMDLFSLYTYINTDLLSHFQRQRKTNEVFHNILDAVKKECEELDVYIKVSRLAENQQN